MSVSNLNISKTNKSESVCFGEAFYKPGGACGWRAQYDFQLVMIHRGQMEVFLDEAAPFVVKSGQCVLLTPRPRELLIFDRKVMTYHTWLAMPEPFLDGMSISATVKPTPRTVDAIVRLGMSETNDSVLDSLAITALHSYLAPVECHKRPVVQQAIAFINDRISEQLSVEQIAEATFTSPQHLTRLFKADLGTTPANYVWQQRTQRGIELLRSTGLSVQEISVQLGYSSPFHFSRLVKQQTGKSPRALRNEHWESQFL